MLENTKKPPIPRTHIIWSALIIGMAFTYAGIEESFIDVLQRLDFIISFILNTFEAGLLIYLTYSLYFYKKLNFWLILLITLAVFLALEFGSYHLFDYDTKETTEFFSLTIPFGSMVILAFNLYYQMIRNQNRNKVALNENTETLWLDTVSGRVKILETAIRYAYLNDAYLEINTEEAIHKTFYSLKQLEDLIVDKSRFFRLNKQYLGQKASILTYKSLSDGRLEISLPNERKCVVSKNKASSFKRWLDEPK